MASAYSVQWGKPELWAPVSGAGGGQAPAPVSWPWRQPSRLGQVPVPAGAVGALSLVMPAASYHAPAPGVRGWQEKLGSWHCARGALRGSLWSPGAWADPAAQPRPSPSSGAVPGQRLCGLQGCCDGGWGEPCDPALPNLPPAWGGGWRSPEEGSLLCLTPLLWWCKASLPYTT